MKCSAAFVYCIVLVLFICTSCSGLSGITGTNESACNCMYFDSGTNRFISNCTAMDGGREPVTKIVVGTQATGNFDFNTRLKDTSLATPSYTFNLALDAQAIDKIKSKGLAVMVYTGNSNVWYKLNIDPASLGTTGKHFFTLYKRGL